MIKAENIVKTFEDNEVLKSITAEFYEGKTNLIIGRSGAGKTVLLKILIGLMTPTSGKVWFDDVDFFDLDKYFNTKHTTPQRIIHSNNIIII